MLSGVEVCSEFRGLSTVPSGWDTRSSIKMQKAVGGKKVDKGCHIFPEYMREYTTDVYYETYMVYRKDW